MLPHGKVLLLNRSSLAALNQPPLPKYRHKAPPQLPHTAAAAPPRTAPPQLHSHSTIRLFTAQTLTLCAQSCGTHTNLSLFIFHHSQRWSFVNTTPGSAQTKRLVFGWRRRLLEDTVGARLKIGECEDVCLVPKSWQREVWRRSVKKLKWIWLIKHVDAAVGEVFSCSISFKVTPTCENTHILFQGHENLFWQPSRFCKFAWEISVFGFFCVGLVGKSDAAYIYIFYFFILYTGALGTFVHRFWSGDNLS